MGAENQAKGKVGRRQRKHAPRRVQRRQSQAGDQPGKPPPGEWFAPAPCAAWVQPQGCKGRSPLHKKTLNPPFPVGEGGRGDGAEIKLKAG